MKKRGAFEWETIAKWLIALIFLIIIALIIYALKEKGYDILDKFKTILRFGL